MYTQKNTIFIKPTTIIIGENEYKIKTDFITWIKFDLLIQDKELDNVYVLSNLVKKLIFEVEPKEDTDSIFKALFSFYSMYRNQKEFRGKQATEQIYDFKKDWSYVFGAFMQQYAINLYETELHWFEFKSMFDCLKGTRLNDIMDVRSTELNDVDDSKKKELKHIKDYYSLDEIKRRKKAKDIEDEIMRKLGSDKHD